MRIAIVVTQGEPGGVQVFLAGFMKWLVSLGHEVRVFCGPGAWLEIKCRESGIPFTRLEKLRREIGPHDLPALLELKREFARFKPDAVHLNSSKVGIVGSLAARMAGVPRIAYRIGGWVFLEDLSAWKRGAYLLAERWTAPFKDVIICVHPGDVAAAKTARIRPRKEIACVPNGIDLATFDADLLPREAARARLAGASGFVFGTISNFYPPKDLPRYMEACAHVVKRAPEAKFVLIGDGEQRTEIESAIKRHGLERHVILAGQREDADRLYRAFDAFVLPSTKEGMSWGLLRAMAAGIACVATDVGAAKWMLADGGLTVPAKNPVALADAMQKIMHDPVLRNELSQKARLQVETRFPLEKTHEGNLAALLD